MNKTWKPTIGGILSIIYGSLGVLAFIMVALGGSISWLIVHVYCLGQ